MITVYTLVDTIRTFGVSLHAQQHYCEIAASKVIQSCIIIQSYDYVTRAYEQAKRQKTSTQPIVTPELSSSMMTPTRPGNNHAEETPPDESKGTEELRAKRKLEFPDQPQ